MVNSIHNFQKEATSSGILESICQITADTFLSLYSALVSIFAGIGDLFSDEFASLKGKAHLAKHQKRPGKNGSVDHIEMEEFNLKKGKILHRMTNRGLGSLEDNIKLLSDYLKNKQMPDPQYLDRIEKEASDVLEAPNPNTPLPIMYAQSKLADRILILLGNFKGLNIRNLSRGRNHQEWTSALDNLEEESHNDKMNGTSHFE